MLHVSQVRVSFSSFFCNKTHKDTHTGDIHFLGNLERKQAEDPRFRKNLCPQETNVPLRYVKMLCSQKAHHKHRPPKFFKKLYTQQTIRKRRPPKTLEIICSHKTNRKHRPPKILAEICSPKDKSQAQSSNNFGKAFAPNQFFLLKTRRYEKRSLHVFLPCSFLLPVRSLGRSFSLSLSPSLSLFLSPFSISLFLYGQHIL